MEFAATFKILFKSQMICALVVGLLTTFGLAISGRDGFNAVFALPINAIIFFLLSAPIYYSFGVFFHRIFLKYKLYNIFYTVILSLSVASLFLIIFVVVVGSFPNLEVLFQNLLLIFCLVCSQTLLIRYFTLKKLKQG